MTDFSGKLFFIPMPDPMEQLLNILKQLPPNPNRLDWIEEKTEKELLRENIDEEWDW